MEATVACVVRYSGTCPKKLFQISANRSIKNKVELTKKPRRGTHNFKMTTIALGFKDLSVLVKNPAKSILSNVSGYVEKGCITAGNEMNDYDIITYLRI